MFSKYIGTLCSMMYAASSVAVVERRKEFVAQKEVLRNELEVMYKSNQALFSGRRTNFVDTQERDRLVSEAFRAAIVKIDRHEIDGD